jgi:hypothetical protein
LSSNQDPARLIAERIARRIDGEPKRGEYQSPPPGNGGKGASENRRARIINFISAAPPPQTNPSIGSNPEATIDVFESRPAPQVAQSPWLAPFSRVPNQANSQFAIGNPQSADHPSQERFGVEEAVVSELVEFFENEKQCSVDPSGKPCDHCAMCSSRGF